jgi:hypothetical protein
MPDQPAARGTCPKCYAPHALKKNGTLRHHTTANPNPIFGRVDCPGAGQRPVDPVVDLMAALRASVEAAGLRRLGSAANERSGDQLAVLARVKFEESNDA